MNRKNRKNISHGVILHQHVVLLRGAERSCFKIHSLGFFGDLFLIIPVRIEYVPEVGERQTTAEYDGQVD